MATSAIAAAASLRPECPRPGHLESPDAPELLPAESSRPVGAIGWVGAPGAVRLAAGSGGAAEEASRRLAAAQAGERRAAASPQEQEQERDPATGEERRHPGDRCDRGGGGSGSSSGGEWTHGLGAWRGSSLTALTGEARGPDGTGPASRRRGPEDPRSGRAQDSRPEVRRHQVSRPEAGWRRDQARHAPEPAPPAVVPRTRAAGKTDPGRDAVPPAAPAGEGGPRPGGRLVKNGQRCRARRRGGATWPAGAPTRSAAVTAMSAPATTSDERERSAVVRRGPTPAHSGRATTAHVSGRTRTHLEREREGAGPAPERRTAWPPEGPPQAGQWPAAPRQAIAALSQHHALPPEIATEIRNAADIATDPAPGAPGRPGRVGLRRLRARALPRCAARHQARGRRGSRRGRRA